MAPRDQPSGEMPFLEHLEELRWRLLWSVLALLVGVTGMLILTTQVRSIDVIAILAAPMERAMPGQKLVVLSPMDNFTILLQVSFAMGVVFASPVIGWQVWGFLSPALHPHEKRVVVPVILGAVLLFVAGVALSVLWVLPVMLDILVGLSSSAVQPMIAVREYFSFAVSMSLAFGVVFELPIVILALTALGLVTPRTLVNFRRHAFVGSVLVAAIVTPGDAIIGTLMLMGPLYGLYELSIVLSWVVVRMRRRREAAEAARPGAAAA